VGGLIDKSTPTRGAVAPLFFAQSKEAFQNLAWFPGLAPGVGSGADAQGRKLTLKIAKRIERKRSQKLGQKKGAYAPLIFKLALS